MKIKKYILLTGIAASILLSVFLVKNHFRNSAPVVVAENSIPEKIQIDANVSPGWFDLVKSKLESSSYTFRPLSDAEYTVMNASHRMQATMNSNSMTVHGISGEANWQARIQFAGIKTNVGEIEKGSLQKVNAEGNYLSYQFDNLTIEYMNAGNGIRQNFIVNKAPAEATTLALSLNVMSDLNTHVLNDELILTKGGSYMYRYQDLKVWDSNGEKLDAYMSKTSDNQIALCVDVENAKFPVTIDPLSTTYAWKFTGGQEEAKLGFWIAGNGDLNNDGFDDVAVGAAGYTNTYMEEGALFVFYGSASGLSTTPSWVKYGEQEGANLGRCVSMEGDVNNDNYDDLIVGAPAYDQDSYLNQGKAWVYLGGPAGLGTTSVWSFTPGRKQAKFGDAVAIVYDTNGDNFDDIVVGAHAWDDNEVLGAVDIALGNKAGKFWVFHGNPTGVNTTPHMECVGLATDANLGVSVDGAGDVNGDSFGDIQIGGYIFLIGDGMICTFHGGPTGCDNIPDFMAVGGAEDTSFYAVNLSQAGDINGDGYTDVLIGMPRFDTYGVYNAGKLRYHFGSPSGMDTVKHDLLGEGQYDERWAFNVNNAGDINKDGFDDVLLTAKHYALTGMYGDSIGRVYLYLGSPNGLSQQPFWTFEGESISGIGTNISSAGDVNGDGLLDIIASGDGYTGDFDEEGVAYLFYGTEQVCDPPANFQVPDGGLGPTSVTFTWDWVYGSYSYKVYIKKVGSSSNPLVITTQSNNITVTGLTPESKYKCYVKAQCQAGWTASSKIITIATPFSPKSTENDFKEVSIFPNPVKDMLNINFGSSTGNIEVHIIDGNGRMMFNNIYAVETPNETIQIAEVANLPKGVYFVQVVNGTVVTTTKITKSN